MSDDEYEYVSEDEDSEATCQREEARKRGMFLVNVIATVPNMPQRGTTVTAALRRLQELREAVGSQQACDNADDYVAAVQAVRSAVVRTGYATLRSDFRPAVLHAAARLAAAVGADHDLQERLQMQIRRMEAQAGPAALRLGKGGGRAANSDVEFLQSTMHVSAMQAAALLRDLQAAEATGELTAQLRSVQQRLQRHRQRVAQQAAEREQQARERRDAPEAQRLLQNVSTLVRERRRARGVLSLARARSTSPCRTACGDAGNAAGIVVYFTDTLGMQTCKCVDADLLFQALLGQRTLVDVDGQPIHLSAGQVARAVRILRRRCFPIQTAAGGAAVVEVPFPRTDRWVEGIAIVNAEARPSDAIGTLALAPATFAVTAVEVHSRNAVAFRPWEPVRLDELQVAWMTSFLEAQPMADEPHVLLSVGTAHALGISTGDRVRWRFVQPPAVTKVWLTGRIRDDEDAAQLERRIGIVNVLYTGMAINDLLIHDMAPACVGTLPTGSTHEVEYEVVDAAQLERAAAAAAAQRAAAAAIAFANQRALTQMLAANRQQRFSSSGSAAAGAGGGGSSTTAAAAAAAAAAASPDAVMCAVCMDAITDDDELHVYTCGHAMHQACFDDMAAHGSTACPYCGEDDDSAPSRKRVRMHGRS